MTFSIRAADSLEQRSEALKVLVEQEFDRFVGVKAATEAVFEEMRIGPLQPEADYSTAELREALRRKPPSLSHEICRLT